MTADRIDLFEINEAYAAVSLVSSKILVDGDEVKTHKIRERLNVNGGAIAIGHPVGASGARILMTLTYGLRRRGEGYGVAAVCGGLSQGDAVLIEAEQSDYRIDRRIRHGLEEHHFEERGSDRFPYFEPPRSL